MTVPKELVLYGSPEMAETWKIRDWLGNMGYRVNYVNVEQVPELTVAPNLFSFDAVVKFVRENAEGLEEYRFDPDEFFSMLKLECSLNDTHELGEVQTLDLYPHIKGAVCKKCGKGFYSDSPAAEEAKALLSV